MLTPALYSGVKMFIKNLKSLKINKKFRKNISVYFSYTLKSGMNTKVSPFMVRHSEIHIQTK